MYFSPRVTGSSAFTGASGRAARVGFVGTAVASGSWAGFFVAVGGAVTTTSGFAVASEFATGASAGFCGRTSVRAAVAGAGELAPPAAGAEFVLLALVAAAGAAAEPSGLSLGFEPVAAGVSVLAPAAGFAADHPPFR